MIARSLVAACLVACVAATPGQAESGIASVYGYSGGPTASGERANPRGLTAHTGRSRSARWSRSPTSGTVRSSRSESTIAGHS